jgi:hypothetical protein
MKRQDDMNKTYSGPDRRDSETHIVLTDDQIDAIAKKAAMHAVGQLTDHVYKQIGKGVLSKVFWIVGVIAVSLYLWLKSKGVIS